MKPSLTDRSVGRCPAHLVQPPYGGNTRQRGYVMVLSMLILLLITIMSISMSKSFFMEEGMAGNIREKNRSFVAAQAALSYAEDYLKFAPGLGTACAIGTTTSVALGSIQVCNNPVTVLGSPNGVSVMPLTGYFPVSTLPNMSVSITGGTDKYFASPGVYIQFLGTVLQGGHIYQVTAFGYGGSQNSVSVVQSNFYVAPGASSKGM